MQWRVIKYPRPARTLRSAPPPPPPVRRSIRYRLLRIKGNRLIEFPPRLRRRQRVRGLGAQQSHHRRARERERATFRYLAGKSEYYALDTLSGPYFRKRAAGHVNFASPLARARSGVDFKRNLFTMAELIERGKLIVFVAAIDEESVSSTRGRSFPLGKSTAWLNWRWESHSRRVASLTPGIPWIIYAAGILEIQWLDL